MFPAPYPYLLLFLPAAVLARDDFRTRRVSVAWLAVLGAVSVGVSRHTLGWGTMLLQTAGNAALLLLSGTALFGYLRLRRLAVRHSVGAGDALFLLAVAAAIVLADMVAGIFKHAGPLKALWSDFPPRWRPMFTPSLEGLAVPPDTLMQWRFEGRPTPGIVHVPAGALGGKYGTVSSHAATIVALLVLSAAEIRRRWFTILMGTATLLICYSRIYLAKHFPFDLLLGAVVGALTAWAAWVLYRHLRSAAATDRNG